MKSTSNGLITAEVTYKSDSVILTMKRRNEAISLILSREEFLKLTEE